MGRGHVTGVLAEHADGFRAWLLAEGYTEGSAARLVHLMAHLSRWMDAVGLSAGELTSPVIERFMAARRAEGYVGWRTAHALVPLVSYLEEHRCRRQRRHSEASERASRSCSAAMTPISSPSATSRSRADAAIWRLPVSFLAWLERVDVTLGSLSAATVSEFVRLECARRAPGSASTTTTGMRSLLRFLYLDGHDRTLLTDAVPSPAGWQLAALPRAITATTSVQRSLPVATEPPAGPP